MSRIEEHVHTGEPDQTGAGDEGSSQTGNAGQAPSSASGPLSHTRVFDPRFRSKIAWTAGRHKPLRDLATSFPALLFALATGYGTRTARKDATAIVMQGGTLRAASSALGLPYWTRKLPAQALIQPLGPLPGGDRFDHRMLNLIPRLHKPRWLANVSAATMLCDEAFGSWMAAHEETLSREVADTDIAWLAVWAWVSMQAPPPPQAPTTGEDGAAPDALQPSQLEHAWRATRFLNGRFMGSIGINWALREMQLFRRRVHFMAQFEAVPSDMAWLRDAQIGDYAFQILRTTEDLLDEAEAMDNCLDHYVGPATTGHGAMVSIRKEGRSVADLEVVHHPDSWGVPHLAHLRARRNKKPPQAVWRAAHLFLADQPWSSAQKPAAAPAPHAAKLLRTFWKPYLDHVRATPHATSMNALLTTPPARPPGEPRRAARLRVRRRPRARTSA